MTDYHPGLEGVIATESSISDINGEKGILSYRGYSIEELAEKSTFEETALLLLTGELPTAEQLSKFTRQINSRRDLPSGMIDLLKTLPKDSNPMDVIQLAVSSLGTFYPINFDAEELKDKKNIRVVSMPCSERFDEQSDKYKTSVLGHGIKRVAIEASHEDWWRKYVGLEGEVIGMNSFGESAPGDDLFEHFGFTKEKIIKTLGL